MIKSMTGYGKRAIETPIGQITIELRVVNNRYIEVYPNLPDFLSEYELKLVNQIKEFVKRGSVNLNIKVEELAEGREILNFNPQKLKNVYSSLKDIKYTLDLDDDVKISDILKFTCKFTEEEEVAAEKIYKQIAEELENVLADADAMRIAEGQALFLKLQEYIQIVKSNLSEIVAHSRDIKDDVFEHYKEEIQDLLQESDIDEDRILQEAALITKKIDITEECDRALSHIDQMKHYMETEDGLTGKKLNFLAQEMHRELNTIGAKSNDSSISHLVVEAKNEIEKIKEQIRNIL